MYLISFFSVVGNKIDLLRRREVDSKVSQVYAKIHNMLYKESSAMTRQGVDDVFYTLVREIRHCQELHTWGDRSDVVHVQLL